MNGAYVDGRILTARPGVCIVAVRSHVPDERIDLVSVRTEAVRGCWDLAAGTRVAFAGRLKSDAGALILEASTAWVDGSEVSSYSRA